MTSSLRCTSSLPGCGHFAGEMCFAGEQWQILLLGQPVFGVPHGELSEFQLDWLETKLAAEPERHTLLLLHHHPSAGGLQLARSAQPAQLRCALDRVLAKFPRVKNLLCGHIHRGTGSDWNGRRMLATYRPAFSLSRTAPTLRWIPSRRAGAGWNCMPTAR